MNREENRKEFFQAIAKDLARQIDPSEDLKSFVGDNPTLIGAYAEAQVRRFVRKSVAPLRVSHGAVIYSETGDVVKARQLDTIMWIPNPLPAIFEADEFALVPRNSSREYWRSRIPHIPE